MFILSILYIYLSIIIIIIIKIDILLNSYYGIFKYIVYILDGFYCFIDWWVWWWYLKRGDLNIYMIWYDIYVFIIITHKYLYSCNFSLFLSFKVFVLYSSSYSKWLFILAIDLKYCYISPLISLFYVSPYSKIGCLDLTLYYFI